MATIFEVRVAPSSGRNKWILDKAGKLKCYLKNPPEKGLANKELIKLVAKGLSLAKADVEIVSGATSRNKRIKVPVDMTFDQIIAAFGIEKQQSLF